MNDNIKTYYEYLNDISNEELFEGFLGYGMFSDKIIPFLTSEKFFNFVKDNPNEKFGFDNKTRKYISYENIRNINIPRVLAIPHPISYKQQCEILKKHWNKILKYFHDKTQNNKYKISRIHIRKMKNERKLFEMNYKNFKTDDFPEPKLLIGKKYIVRADISNCFPSIYTHSIPWALVGKTEAKANKNNNSKWYNEIDKYCRNLKDNETHGILIGPHASNLISEIILVAIDEKLSKNYDYIRNIDDYTCYVETYEKAERFLIDLSNELKKFNLVLNHKKTQILPLPFASVESWIRKLNSFIFPENRKLKLSEVRNFLDMSLDLMKKNNENSAILNYAIKILSNKQMTKNAKEYFINTLHHLILIYPYLISLLEKEVFIKLKVDEAAIKDIALNIFKMAKEKRLTESMGYAIYFALKYNFKISDNLFEDVQESNDAVLLLLAYLHDEKYINHSNVRNKYKDLAKSLKDNMDEYWIFVYEVLTVGLLENEWKKMKENNISFIKDEFKA